MMNFINQLFTFSSLCNSSSINLALKLTIIIWVKKAHFSSLFFAHFSHFSNQTNGYTTGRDRIVIIWILPRNPTPPHSHFPHLSSRDSSAPSPLSLGLCFLIPYSTAPFDLVLVREKHPHSLPSLNPTVFLVFFFFFFSISNGRLCRRTSIRSVAAESVHPGWASELEISRKFPNFHVNYRFVCFDWWWEMVRTREWFFHYGFVSSSPRSEEKAEEVSGSPTCLPKCANSNTSERISRRTRELHFFEIRTRIWMTTLISNFFFG